MPNKPADSVPAGRVSLRLLRTPQVGRLLIAAGLLGLLTIGDGFLYLELTERASLATALRRNQLRLSRAGRAARSIGGSDRVHPGVPRRLRRPAPLLPVRRRPAVGPAASVACLLLLGAYYAATDGVLSAIAARIVDTSVRTSGIATAQTIVAAARFASSLLFGLMWPQLGRLDALWIMTGSLAIAIPIAALLFRRINRSRTATPTPAEF
jgi:hypothetical protein